MDFYSPKNSQWLIVKRQFLKLSLNLFRPLMSKLSCLYFFHHIYPRHMQLKISLRSDHFAITLTVAMVTTDLIIIMAIMPIEIFMETIVEISTIMASTNPIIKVFSHNVHVALEFIVKYVDLQVMRLLIVMTAWVLISLERFLLPNLLLCTLTMPLSHLLHEFLTLEQHHILRMISYISH